MAQRALRFGIRDDGHRAATWKIWTETSGGRSEVYLVCRALGGVVKASLHESGRWHLAYSPGAYQELVEGAIPAEDRFIDRWDRPPEFAQGLTLAYRIVTPSGAATTEVDATDANEIIWLPDAPQGRATEVVIFISAPSARCTNWPGKRGMGTDLVGAFVLNNDSTVWVVSHAIEMPTLPEAGTGNFLKGRSERDLEGDGLRALVWGNADDGSRVLYDCPVERKGTEP